MRFRDDYATALAALLPRGAAWARDPESVLQRLLAGLAGALERADARAWDLLDEADPRTAFETLAEWERAYGLPDPCAPVPELLDERRDALLGRIRDIGGQSRAYFIAEAAALGYAVTIDEFDPMTCVDPCTANLYGEDWNHAWRLNAPAETIREATCIDPCTAPLRAWGNESLECTIARLKPAHTIALHAYA